MVAFPELGWMVAISSVALCFSSFGNGANDVANAYANSVAARSLTLLQVGILAMFTEFIGAVAMGSRVTGTIKNNIIDTSHYIESPSVLMVVMGCAEIAAAAWLMLATKVGFPVSTTQTIVGAIIGAGIGSGASVSWGWSPSSVSQIAASWVIAPLIAGCFAAILFASLKFFILEREDSFKKALRAIPFYLAFTGAVLALFITIQAPGAPDLKSFGAGNIVGIVLGVFFGVLAIAYIFFMPYFHRVVVKEDPRLRPWHLPLGPLLWKEDPPLYWPGKGDSIVIDYYEKPEEEAEHAQTSEKPAQQQQQQPESDSIRPTSGTDSAIAEKKKLSEYHSGNENNNADTITTEGNNRPGSSASDVQQPRLRPATLEDVERGNPMPVQRKKRQPEPEERWLEPYRHLPLYNSTRLWNLAKYAFLQGVKRDCVTHSAKELSKIHGRAKRYDNRIEHLWTYCQVASAMMMSIAHGSNDVSNAVGPWVASYSVFREGVINEDVNTPVWILAAAGFLLGAGFWVWGHHIVKAMGNKITQLSPTRGYCMELGAAITVLMASQLGLPVSTTQCLLGAIVGVALMNLDPGAVNWRQIGVIFSGWVLTLPCSGLLAGLLCAMALNAPQFG